MVGIRPLTFFPSCLFLSRPGALKNVSWIEVATRPPVRFLVSFCVKRDDGTILRYISHGYKKFPEISQRCIAGLVTPEAFVSLISR
ncbi:hypothetical protein CGRA01v4_07021 [Colletotrichum graminicola]|nr:hypothetical protein CGRA01v4_07021 [Colletotrichum graminicola]